MFFAKHTRIVQCAPLLPPVHAAKWQLRRRWHACGENCVKKRMWICGGSAGKSSNASTKQRENSLDIRIPGDPLADWIMFLRSIRRDEQEWQARIAAFHQGYGVLEKSKPLPRIARIHANLLTNMRKFAGIHGSARSKTGEPFLRNSCFYGYCHVTP